MDYKLVANAKKFLNSLPPHPDKEKKDNKTPAVPPAFTKFKADLDSDYVSSSESDDASTNLSFIPSFGFIIFQSKIILQLTHIQLYRGKWKNGHQGID